MPVCPSGGKLFWRVGNVGFVYDLFFAGFLCESGHWLWELDAANFERASQRRISLQILFFNGTGNLAFDAFNSLYLRTFEQGRPVWDGDGIK